MEKGLKIAVIGSGSWATAIVKILLNNAESINWFVRNPQTIAFIKEHHINPNYLSSATLEVDKVHFYNDIEEIIKDSQILIFAIPAAFLKETLKGHKFNFEGKLVVSAIKGIVPVDNLTIAEYFNRIYKVLFDNIAIVTGPCHAEEIALERLSYLTFASKNLKTAQMIADQFTCRYVKTITTKDIYGTEYSAVLKNIFAIASGICHGLGYGDNFQAVLVSNAAREIDRFLDKTYASKRSTNSSAYLGDLLVTCYSQFSRNRTFGMMIGKGYSVKFAQMEMNMVAEGYYAVKSIKELNVKFNVKMPIVDAVYNILYEKISPSVEIKLLSEKLK
jgi:glycerol-3-phosphate dehydrogenase (NAD(P)+)